MAHDDDPISLDRFLWVQDFVARLAELGAPEASEKLEALGQRLYPDNKELEAAQVADVVWERWPSSEGESFFGDR